MKKLSVQIAAEILGITDLKQVTLPMLKRIYKRAIMTAHPDLGGKKEDAQLLNSAYSALKVYVPKLDVENTSHEEGEVFTEREVEDWFYKRTDGHPLHDSRLASMFSLVTLIKDAFHIAESIPNIDSLSGHTYRKGVFFQDQGRDYRLGGSLWQHNSFYTITDVTEFGQVRGSTYEITILVDNYSPEYDERTAFVSNVMREWLGKKEFSWASFYTQMMQAWHTSLELKSAVDVYGCSFVMVSESRGTVTMKDKSVLTITFKEVPLNKGINPFDLSPFKPLKQAPRKWKIRDLVCVLLNGQFYGLKRDYYYTDDYALDNANRFSKGYYDNPIEVALKWVGAWRRSCTSLYDINSNGCITFGFHSNDSSTLRLDISNRYPIVDIEEEVTMISNVVLKLSDKVA
ncbi:hypothetical protein KW507_15730 [Vibrio fluvialis]|nr:hypothetical protein [Vibrio fluvialis]